MSGETDLRDDIGMRLRYHQPANGRSWTGPCIKCQRPRGTVSISGYSCPDCRLQRSLDDLAQHVIGEGPEDDAEELPAFVLASEAKEGQPPAYLIESFLLDGEIAALTGDGGSGKTSVALGIAAAVVGGYAVFDRFSVLRSGPVMIVSEEDGAAVIANRAEALCGGHGWDAEKVMGSLHILALAGVRLTSCEWQDHILQHARDIEPVLVIFDPLAELIDGDENSNTDARPAIRFLRRLTKETGAAVLVVHHAGKKGDGKRKLDQAMRGASAWNAAARAIYALGPVEGGVAVETIKLSRAEPPRPFVLKRHVETDQNPAAWVRARLTWHSAPGRTETIAERFVLDQLTNEPGPNTTAIKRMAKERNALGVEPGISGKDISDGLRRLVEAGRIEYEEGARGARKWYKVLVPSVAASDVAGQGRQDDSLSLPNLARQGQPPHPATLPTPIGGKASGGTSGQSQVDDLLDVASDT